MQFCAIFFLNCTRVQRHHQHHPLRLLNVLSLNFLMGLKGGGGDTHFPRQNQVILFEMKHYFLSPFDFQMLPTVFNKFSSLLANFEHFMWKNLKAILLINPTNLPWYPLYNSEQIVLLIYWILLFDSRDSNIKHKCKPYTWTSSINEIFLHSPRPEICKYFFVYLLLTFI